MITKSIKTTEGKIILSVPTTLDELTIGQLRDLQKDGLSDIETLSILSYCPIETLYTIRKIEDIAVFKDAAGELTYNLGFAYNSEIVPDKVVISGKSISVIKNLNVEPVGAYMNAKDIIADEINKAIDKFGNDNWKDNFKPSTQSCIELLAQYFYCRVTGNVYQEYEVLKFQDELKYLPVSQALPIARFFFLKYPNLEMPKINFLKLLQMLIQQKRALRNLRRSDRLTRLTHSQEGTF